MRNLGLSGEGAVDPGELGVGEVVGEGKTCEGVVVDEAVAVSSKKEVEHIDNCDAGYFAGDF